MPKKELIILVTIAILGFFFRVYKADLRITGPDEVGSKMTAAGVDHRETYKIMNRPFNQGEIFQYNNLSTVKEVTITSESGNTLFYTSILHVWMKVFGKTDMSAKMMSILFDMLSLGMVYLLSYTLLKSRKIALLCFALYAFHPFMIEYAKVIRSYPMGTFLTLLSTYLFVALFSPDKIPLLKKQPSKLVLGILYGLVSLACLMTHYFCFYILLIHGLVALVKWKSFSFRYYFLGSGVMVVLFAGWFFNGGQEGLEYMKIRNKFHQNYMSIENRTVKSIQPTTTANSADFVFKTFTTWTLSEFYYRYLDHGVKMRYVSIIFLLSIALLIVGLYHALKNQEFKYPYLGFLFLLGLAFVGPLNSLVQANMSGHTVAYLPKYLTFSSPYFIILFACAIYYFVQYNKRAVYLGVLIPLGANMLFNFRESSKLWFSDDNYFTELRYSFKDYVKDHPDIDLSQYTMLFNDEGTALKSNFELPKVDIQQAIRHDSTPKNEVYLEHRQTGEKIKLYSFPEGFVPYPGFVEE